MKLIENIEYTFFESAELLAGILIGLGVARAAIGTILLGTLGYMFFGGIHILLIHKNRKKGNLILPFWWSILPKQARKNILKNIAEEA